MSVHVVGNVCIDTTYRVPRFPAPGETLVASSSFSGIGGKGANQAFAAARAGAQTALYAPVGTDAATIRIRLALHDERLGLHFTEIGPRTDSSLILVRDDGENLIVSDTACARAFDPLAPAAGFAEAVRQGDVVLLQGNLAAGPTIASLEHARGRGAKTILNPSPLEPGCDFAWAMIDLVVANLGEIQRLTGEIDPRAGAAALQERGAGDVVVTLGSEGVFLVTGSGCCRITAPKVRAIDTSGAGDILCGAAAGLIARGLAADAAFAKAVAAAAFSVTRQGALESCPSAAEILAAEPTAIQWGPR